MDDRQPAPPMMPESARKQRPIYSAYYRAWKDAANGSGENPSDVTLLDLPDDIDLVNIIANDEVTPLFWQRLPYYVDSLHERGILVARTIFYKAFWNTGLVDKELADPLLPFENTTRGYRARAKQIEDQYIGAIDYDALIVDVDINPLEDDRRKALGVFTHLSEHWGPHSQSQSQRLLIVDHDILLDDLPDPLVESADRLSYYFYDSYGKNLAEVENHLEKVSPFIAPSQFVPGFSFYEERGQRWGDIAGPFPQSRAMSLAHWSAGCSIPRTKKGGLFAYAIDRDGVHEGDDIETTSNFEQSKQLSKIIHSTGSSN